MKLPQLKSADWLAILLLGFCSGASGQAPIVLDGSTPGFVFGSDLIRIQGGQLSSDGANLFHNFSGFNIPENKSAAFLNRAAGIRNIIARVTGSESSTIGGNLRTELGPTGMDQARVFLLNPHGVLFNGNSSINLSALTVSTANSLQFDGGANVTPGSTTDDLRNVSGNPVGFGDLNDIGSVKFDGARILMTGGGDILVIAKDVEFKNGSRITTDGSQVVVAGAGAGNSVSFDISDRHQLPVLAQPATGSVRMEGFSGISTSDAAGGRIVIRGGEITLINSNSSNAALNVTSAGGNPGVGIDVEATQSLTLTRSQITTGSDLRGSASEIRIHAPVIQLDNEIPGINESAIRTNGRGGDIGIVATSLTIRDGEISTNAKDGGTGGSMNIQAEELTITDRSSIQSVAETSSNGGDIHVEIAGNLSIDGNGATRIDGSGRRILETVGITANTLGSGQGGEISVDVGGNITLMNGALIDSTTFSDGNAGRISVSAGNLSIDGENFDFATGITAFTVDQSSLTAGQGGDLAVNVRGDIRIVNGGEIDTSSFGAGNAGRVSINEGLSSVTGGLVIDKGTATRFTGIGSDASGSGDAGEVTVRAMSLSIDNGGLISTAVFYQPEIDGMGNTVPVNPGTGRGGDVNVFSNSLLIRGASLEADDGTSVVLNSAIYAGTQAGSSGAGGGVFIGPLDMALEGSRPSIQLSNGAEIGARAEGTGAGGSVEIRFAGGQVDLDSASSISARSGELGGNAGSVTVEAQEITLRNNSSISSTNEADSSIGGDAGSVILIPDKLTVDGSSLEVSAIGGDAGEIRIKGIGLLDFLNSQVVAEAFDDGGDVVIVGAQSLILDHSRVSANAINGDGGNIELEAVVILANESSITASSELGVDGIVNIDSQAVLTGTEDELDASPLDLSDQLQPECTKRLANKSGSFIRTGSGGTARLPGGYLPSVRLHSTR